MGEVEVKGAISLSLPRRVEVTRPESKKLCVSMLVEGY